MFLSGLSYRIEEMGSQHIVATRSHAGRIVDRMYVRWCEKELGREQWREHTKAFDSAKKGGTGGKRWFVYPEAFSFSSQRAADAEASGFRPIGFSSFLDKFFGLDEVVDSAVGLLKGRNEDERAEFKELLDTYIDQDVQIGDSPLDQKAKDYVLKDWFSRPGAQVLVLLAPAGHGKTALTRILAYQLLNEYKQGKKSPVPVLIPFGTYRKLVTYRALILEYFEDLRHPTLMDAFNVMLDAGRLFLILDGFDELCEQVGTAVAQENLQTIANGLRVGGKAILTSRTTFFRTSVQGLKVITSVVKEENVTVSELMPLDEEQQKEFAVKLCEGDKGRANSVLSIARSVTGPEGVAGSPFLLKQLVRANAGQPGSDFTHAMHSYPLYELMLREICKREIERQGYQEFGIGVEEQIPFLEDAAEWIYEDISAAEGSAKSDGLPTGTISFLVECNFEGKFRTLANPERGQRELIEKLTHHALLTAPEQADRVQFIHHTWRDFLVARRLQVYMRQQPMIEKAARMLSQRPVPEWVVAFLASALQQGQLNTLVTRTTPFRDPRIFPKILAITLKFCELAEANDKHARTALFFSILGEFKLRGKRIPQVRFAHLELSGQSFESSELRETHFIDTGLQKAFFKGSNLTGAVFQDCDLRGASFRKTILTNTSFEDCDVEGAEFVDVVGLDEKTALSLHGGGAVLDLPDLPKSAELSEHDIAKFLVRGVLEKVRQKASVIEAALERGVSPRFKPLVRNLIVPRLKTLGYLSEINRPPKYIVKRNEDMNRYAWALVDRGEASPDLARLIEDVAGEVKRHK